MSLDCLKMGEASAPQNGDSLISCLPDEILVEILSRMSLKKAGRTSVLSRKWRYLWCTSRSLCFDPMDDEEEDGDPRTAVVSEKLRARVNRVLELHQAPQLDKFIVRFYCPTADVRGDEVDRWVDFALQREVKEFELEFELNCEGHCPYEFPSTEKSAFRSLRSLRLKFVNVKDEVVHKILAACPYLEALVIHFSEITRSLQVFDPLPNLKLLEITYCNEIQSLVVSVMSLVSFQYFGCQTDRVLLKNIPNLTEVSLGGGYALSFIYEGKRHSSYSAQLVEIELRIFYKRANSLALPRLDSLKRVELGIHSQVGESLLFFTLFTKAAPLLCQFKIKLHYILDPEEFHIIKSIRTFSFSARQDMVYASSSYPEACAAGSATFYHENLKLFEMAGYIGCPSEEEFLVQLCKMAPSLEKVVIDTSGLQFEEEPVPYHDEIVREAGASTRTEAMERAKNLKFTSLLGAGGNMIMSSTETKVIWQVETNGKTSKEPTRNTNLDTSYVAGIESSKSNQLS